MSETRWVLQFTDHNDAEHGAILATDEELARYVQVNASDAQSFTMLRCDVDAIVDRQLNR